MSAVTPDAPAGDVGYPWSTRTMGDLSIPVEVAEDITKPVDGAWLDELERLLAKATPGEWTAFCSNGIRAIMKGPRPKVHHTDQKRRWKEIVKWAGFEGTDDPKRENANLHAIVALHNAAPRLIEAARTRAAARVDEATVERDMSGETWMDMRVAAYREETERGGYRCSFHWSTPGKGARNVTRLFAEDDVRAVSPPSAQPRRSR